jgi:phosphatidylserine/phosphatidylglycerophosphate/cardiolipin synthase-like enzyme
LGSRKSKRKRKAPPLPKKYKNLLFILSLILLIAGLIETGVTASTSSLPIEGTSPKLYASQCNDDLGMNLKQALNSAKESILVIIYGLSDQEVIRTLKEKAQQGIQVTVIYDDSASKGLQQKLGNKIRAVPRMGIAGLMHRKIVVIDQKQVWIGSANMTHASLRMHDNLVMGMHAPVIAEVIAAKAATIIKSTKTTQKELPRDFILNGQHLELWFISEDKEALDRLIQLVRSAKKTVRVAMYTWTHPLLAEEVVRAHQRGVKVEVALDRQMSQVTNALVVQKLKQNGIPIGFNKGAQLFHHKFAYIDGSTLAMGSANWTKAAFTRNEDVFIILHQLNEEQQFLMEDLWKRIKSECRIQSEPRASEMRIPA